MKSMNSKPQKLFTASQTDEKLDPGLAIHIFYQHDGSDSLK